MKESKNFIVIDLRTGKPIYGLEEITMCFSTKEVAEEVASYLFKSHKDYLIFNKLEIKTKRNDEIW